MDNVAGIGGSLVPKIEAVHAGVGVPKRTMMRVVVCFVGGVLQGPAPGHGKFIRAEQRIEIGPRHVFVTVFGKELSVDFDTEFALILRNLHAVGMARLSMSATSRQESAQQRHDAGQGKDWLCFHNPDYRKQGSRMTSKNFIFGKLS
jgi:hypothetical protein